MTGKPWHTGGHQPLSLSRKSQQRSAKRVSLELATAADTNAALRQARKSERALEHGLAESIAQYEARKP